METDPEPKGPLIVGIGGLGAHIVSSMRPSPPARLIIDTDSRTKERYPDENVLILGENMLEGEGVGRDLKLGMMAFRSGMSGILPLIREHYPVMIVAGCEGGTGLAGAVELNGVLKRTAVPVFNFIFADDGAAPGSGRLALAANLVAGPLHPGSLVDAGISYIEKGKAIQSLALASAPGPGIRIPLEAWTRLSGMRATFSLESHHMRLEEVANLKEGKGPGLRGACIAALRAPEKLGASDVKGLIESLLGFSENIAVGLLKGDEDGIELASLSQSIDPGPLPAMGGDPDLSEPDLQYSEIDIPIRELHQQS